MKTQFLLPLTVSFLIMSGLTDAAPIADELPPLISTRTQPVTSIPKIDLLMEQAISEVNGPLPDNVEKKGPWALDLPKNETTTAKTATRGDNGVSIASSGQVSVSYLRAELAANAYCRKVVPGNVWDCPHCDSAVSDAKIELSFTTILDDTNGYIITSKSQKTIFLVFRGTNSIRSAIVDLQFIKSKYPPVDNGAEVHTGFYQSYLSVQKKVVTTMDKLFTQYPDYKIDVSGHSLGAAQAVIATMDLFQRFTHISPSNTNLYTYGEPRVGNQKFAAYVKSTGIPKIRTVHSSDIVPHLPPMAMGFVHSGTEYWIKDDQSKATEICQAEFESESCSNTAVPFLSITDHLEYYGINEGLCL
ncbi:Alpha/Beta hydrolase protein [Chlamydoabsidia padenii]|nr:Alpha/Beta hydrolase protein [Chlamydoabsidia padenii]